NVLEGAFLWIVALFLTSYHGFNLDVEEPMVFQEDGAGFGQSVAQLGGSRLVVGAPLEVVAVNQTGRLYDCVAATGLCQPIPLVWELDGNCFLGKEWPLNSVEQEGFLGPGRQLRLTYVSVFPSSFSTECPSQEMDIVFLIDGSGSIYESSFKQMKDFVRALMGHFEGTNTLFSLIQYSHLLKIHFTFTQFQNSWNPLSLVDPIVQLKGLTYTATGIRKVVEELFHSKNGARKSAKKILIVITDGQKYKDPLEYSDVIPQAERAGIIRYAIGVGDAFWKPSAKQELDNIGSEPAQDHVFRVDNFAALSSIQEQLQEKIFALEGTQSTTSSSFQHEMSQEGFSSVLTMDGPVLGAVGSFSWSGGAFLYPPKTSPTFINMSQENVDMRDSYLGYSTELAFWKGVQSLILGAPRHQHTGKVVIFTQASEQWRPKAEVSGTQRIAGSQLSPTLQYFGQSLSGGQDLTHDGLVDLAVGAQGQVLLLRSQPVLNVRVTMRFSPSEVAKAVHQCWEEVPSALEAGNATVCFTIQKSSLDQLGDVQSSVRYDLALDPGRLISRAIFDETKNWTLTRRKTLGMGDYCETVKLLLPDCVEDVVSPIILRLNFSLVGEPIPSAQNLRPVLAVGSQDPFTASLPFEKNCGQDHFCKGDLSVNLSSSSLQTLVVGSSLELNVTVTLWNEGEDSYRTVIHFYYPAGLSYRRVLGTQRPLRLACEAVPTGNEGLRSSSCSINHPIFHEGTKGIFIVTFDVSYKATLGNKLLLRANASSQNNKPSTSKTTSQLELPVKYAVYMVQERSRIGAAPGTRIMFRFHCLQVNNLSQRDVVISINVWVPILLNGVAVWDVTSFSPVFLASTSFPSCPQNCSIADCLKIHCDLPSFGIQEELEFTLKGNLNFGWVSQVCRPNSRVPLLDLSGTDTSVPILKPRMETVLEKYEVYNPIPIIAGSSVGGLLLLALITAILYKVNVFILLLTPPAI
uniref:Integrin alpha-D-like n=1 Tax=Canis lupus dingo TaxID=286419 RepID=A0A8C0R4Q1_CANLU